ncbi:MAG: bifunctional 3-deoxy-7-phosphoheptulonate synthase/chorismate mutase type II [Crocinitomicaceae bacterium]|nr:bifunctional 3-deoxy-7-phosphoheptulonate synthase/chorismate mutase type II [Crocinitomicaceae bacterium]
MNQRSIADIIPLSNWWPGKEKPFLISGPCSVETEEQLLSTARQLAATGGVHLFRGGIWKPRTRPDSFEGVGEAGIEWMVNVKKETGLPIATEVASAHHVELCLNAGFDVLWIGSRTTVNPFSVQEIADALQGSDIPVIVKNPVNPDLQLWIGAIERLQRAGIRKIIAMHRGFSFFGKTIYRNKPMWEIPIGLKTLFPSLEIFCDPSHICGRRDLLAKVAQQALDLGMSGLMIESHISPDKAWSDARQQITPENLLTLINSLHVRTKFPKGENELALLRSEIDRTDEDILHLIAQRMKLAEEIGWYKKENNVMILQIERWSEIRNTRTEWAKKLGLTPAFMKVYLDALHAESIRRQTHIMNEADSKENKPERDII